MHVVVLGAGIGGVSTAAALRSGGFDGRITLVDAAPFPYDRPPLSKDYLAGRLGVDRLALQPPAWFAAQDVRLVTSAAVIGIDVATGSVVLADSTMSADRVVLATGGAAVHPPIPGSADPRVHVLRTLADADRLRAALVPGARVLVVGAGLVGAEVAATAAGLDCEVTLVDPVSLPLAPVVGAPVSAWLHALHGTHEVRTVGAALDRLEPVGGGVAATLTSGNNAIFDVVLLALGMRPVTDLAVSAGLEVDRGVLVDERQVSSNPAVLAIGDAARLRGGATPGHWEAAMLDGQRAAATILGAAIPRRSAPWFWTDRYGHHVEVVGDMGPGLAQVVRGTLGEPPFSVFGVQEGRVRAAVAVDEPNSVRAARRMIDRSLPVDPDALADPGTDLRRLLRG
jgi:NADPH-dependent 2,4-dienoyl-CoA reductase/sulfur reductase-like enzyme